MSEMAYIAMEEGQRTGQRIGKRLRKGWSGHHHDVFLADALEQMSFSYCDGNPERMQHMADRLKHIACRLESISERAEESA